MFSQTLQHLVDIAEEMTTADIVDITGCHTNTARHWVNGDHTISAEAIRLLIRHHHNRQVKQQLIDVVTGGLGMLRPELPDHVELDADRDGQITARDALAAWSEQLAAAQRTCDSLIKANRDGKIDAREGAEILAHQQAVDDQGAIVRAVVLHIQEKPRKRARTV